MIRDDVRKEAEARAALRGIRMDLDLKAQGELHGGLRGMFSHVFGKEGAMYLIYVILFVVTAFGNRPGEAEFFMSTNIRRLFIEKARRQLATCICRVTTPYRTATYTQFS